MDKPLSDRKKIETKLACIEDQARFIRGLLVPGHIPTWTRATYDPENHTHLLAEATELVRRSTELVVNLATCIGKGVKRG